MEKDISPEEFKENLKIVDEGGELKYSLSNLGRKFKQRCLNKARLSPEYMKAWREKHKKKKKCKYCLELFSPSKNNKVYCSIECRKEQRRIDEKRRYELKNGKHNTKEIR